MKNIATKILATVGFLLFTTASITQAQTTYQDNQGFFTPIVKSLYLRGGSFENTQLIGPAVGYRFNENYDFTLHTEFLFSDLGSKGKDTPSYSGLNLGFIIGHSSGHFSQEWIFRSELAVYKSINFDASGYSQFNQPDPKLFSGQFSTTIHRQFMLSRSISLLPNVGGFLGYGDYSPTYSSAHFRHGFDGFQLGPQLGFDVLFKPFYNFYIVLQPQYRIQYNLTNNYSEGTLFFNIQFNF